MKKGNKTGTKKSQKYHNKTGFKLKFKTDKINLRENTNIDRVCERCYEKIQWKLKFGKYKPLKNPGKCQKCERKKVIKPYRILCNSCADENKACAKCGQVKKMHPESQKDANKISEMKRKQEFDRYMSMMQERSRRKIQRLMEDDLVAFEDGKFLHKETGEEITPIYYQKKYWDDLGIVGDYDDEDDLLG